MCHILDEAIDYINNEDSKPNDYDYNCNCCGEGFDKGHGEQISDEKICNECIKEFKHFDYYREAGLSDREIYELTNNTKQL